MLQAIIEIATALFIFVFVIVVAILGSEDKDMKIEECEVGMRVVVLDGNQIPSGIASIIWLHPMAELVGRTYTIDKVGPACVKIAGWWLYSGWLSPAPDEQEEAPAIIGVDPAKPGSDETVVWQSARRNGKSWYQEAMFRTRAFSRLFDSGSQEADPNTAMLARDEVPEETKQVLTREPKENPWYSRITPMSERVKV